MTLIAIILVAIVLGALVITAIMPTRREAQEMREQKRAGKPLDYSCTYCANKRTPLCGHCYFTEHPDGTRSRPTYFSRLNNVQISDIVRDKSKPRDEAVKMVIQRYLDADEPIPIALVHEHNSLREKRGD